MSERLTIDWWKEHRSRIQNELLESSMETVRLIGTLYTAGECTPEKVKAVYAREHAKTEGLKRDLEDCERALLGKR